VGEPFVDEALITKLVPYGDADHVVHLFCREHGRLGAFVRGPRKNAKRRVGLQPMMLVEAKLRPRRGGLLGADQLKPLRHPLGTVVDPEVLGRGAYLVELTEHLVPEGVAEEQTYLRLLAGLDALAHTPQQAEVMRAYELKLLHSMGELLDLNVDFECEAFDVDGRSLLPHAAGKSVAFSEDARKLALVLLHSRLAELPDVEHDRLREVGRLFASFLRRSGLPPLKSVRFLKDLQHRPM